MIVFKMTYSSFIKETKLLCSITTLFL